MGTGLSITDFVKESIKGFYERLQSLKTFKFLKSDNTQKKCNIGDLADGYVPAKTIVSDSGRKILVVFGNTKSVCNLTATGESNFYFEINNFDDNILRIHNIGSNDFGFMVYSVNCKGVDIQDLAMPKNPLSIQPNHIAEISIMSDGNKAYIAWRDDLGLKRPANA